MAKVTQAYADNAGRLHPNAEGAVLADLEAVLGRLGGEGGITAGLAKLVLDKRSEIEKVFGEFDTMTKFGGGR